LSVQLRAVTPEDAADLARIYNHYIAKTIITFETEPVSVENMRQRVVETLALPLPWLVAERGGSVLGYTYASRWKGRCAYRFAVEATIYLDPACLGQGIGRPLYEALIEEIRSLQMHAVIAGISLPNDASVALHEKLGFAKIGHFTEVGYKQERWVDVGYWQLMLQSKGAG
jgi:phosphinothricin acetyltransferase